MANLNKVFLIGNLTRDPELRVTPRGTPICSFSLAISRNFKGEDGAKRQEVTFVEVEAWGKLGEVISKYAVKGRSLLVEGRLKSDAWEDKASGQKRSKIKVVLEQFQFFGGRETGDSGGSEASGDNFTGGMGGSRAYNEPQTPSQAQKMPDDDEDVPF